MRQQRTFDPSQGVQFRANRAQKRRFTRLTESRAFRQQTKLSTLLRGYYAYYGTKIMAEFKSGKKVKNARKKREWLKNNV